MPVSSRKATAGAALLLCLCGLALMLAPARALATAVGPGAPIDFQLFPADNPWNTDISAAPVDPRSSAYLASMGLGTGLHPDFGTTWNGGPNGIPYVLVPGTQPKIPMTFYYADESDPGPYPIPLGAPIEYGSDHHILTLDVDNRILYEVYDAHYNASLGRWECGSGAVWNLNSNALRPDGWTSADAAGLPMLPGLVRYDEVSSGEITHALRFTVEDSQRAYISPATHFASDDTDPNLPPMGLRVRLRAGFDVSGYPGEVQVILRALKKYGMIVADNGGPWYISGAPDPRWDDDALSAISQVKGSDFEVVDANQPPIENTPGAVWRFYNRSSGVHFYTADYAEMEHVRRTLSSAYTYEGVAYVVDRVNPSNSSPLYRFYNMKTGSHFYTADPAEKDRVAGTLPSVYHYDGPAYAISRTAAPGARAIWRFYNRANGSHFYTASAAERDSTVAQLFSTYAYEGTAFYYLAP